MGKDFTIGADPEFCVTNNEGVVFQASKLYKTDSPLGRDGNGYTFEVRPPASYDPLEVVGNIHSILIQASQKERTIPHVCRWQAGSVYLDYKVGLIYPLGGHIHFGTRGMIPARKAVPILSNYIGVCTMAMEDKIGVVLRRQGPWGYGAFNDYRGTNYGFEYRTPSSWITSPYVAASVLCLAKVVMHEILKVKNSDDQLHEVFINALDRNDVKDFCHGDMVAKFWDVWRHVQKMELYPKYESYLGVINDIVHGGKSWFPNTSMKEAWGVAPFETYKIQHVVPKNLSQIWKNYKEQPVS